MDKQIDKLDFPRYLSFIFSCWEYIQCECRVQ